MKSVAKNINDIQNSIIENFELFEDDMESILFYLMDLGKKLPAMPEEHKTEEFIVKGCQSKVWLFPSFADGKVFFEGETWNAVSATVVEAGQTAEITGLVGLTLTVKPKIQ